MADATVRVTVDDARLRQAIQRMPGLFEAAVEKGGRDVEKRAKEIIIAKDIIDTGATLNSTQSRRVERFARRIGPATHYAPFLETGTSRMVARPFMVPALEETRPSFLAAVRAAVEEASRG